MHIILLLCWYYLRTIIIIIDISSVFDCLFFYVFRYTYVHDKIKHTPTVNEHISKYSRISTINGVIVCVEFEVIMSTNYKIECIMFGESLYRVFQVNNSCYLILNVQQVIET